MITVSIIFLFAAVMLGIQKKTNSLQYAMFIPFFCTLIFTVNNPDYHAYEKAFIYGYNPFREAIGFNSLIHWLNGLGIYNYKILLFILGLIVFFCVSFWKSYIGNVHYILFFYSFFVMYYDVIQIRNMIAAFLISLVFLCFFVGGKRIKWILMLALIIIATTFHPLSLLTGLLALYVCLFNYKSYYRLSKNEVLIFMGMGITNVLFGRKIVMYLGNNISFLWKINLYLTKSPDYESFLIWLLPMVFLVFMFYNYGIISIKNNINILPEKKKVIYILFRYISLGVVISGMTLYMNEIVRIFRLFFLISFILYAVIREEISSRNRLILFGSIVFINGGFMLAWIVRGINFDVYW